MRPLSRPCAVFAAACVLAAGACTGPATHVDNPRGHRVFVDGHATSASELPFRYYGTSRWNALPADTDAGRADWRLLPDGGATELPPPASPWFFPLDFPLEVVRRVVLGREDVTTHVELPPTPADQVVETGVPPTGQLELVERAHRARTAR